MAPRGPLWCAVRRMESASRALGVPGPRSERGLPPCAPVDGLLRAACMEAVLSPLLVSLREPCGGQCSSVVSLLRVRRFACFCWQHAVAARAS